MYFPENSRFSGNFPEIIFRISPQLCASALRVRDGTMTSVAGAEFRLPEPIWSWSKSGKWFSGNFPENDPPPVKFRILQPREPGPEPVAKLMSGAVWFRAALADGYRATKKLSQWTIYYFVKKYRSWFFRKFSGKPAFSGNFPEFSGIFPEIFFRFPHNYAQACFGVVAGPWRPRLVRSSDSRAQLHPGEKSGKLFSGNFPENHIFRKFSGKSGNGFSKKISTWAISTSRYKIYARTRGPIQVRLAGSPGAPHSPPWALRRF